MPTAIGFQPAPRTRPIIDRRPASISDRILGHAAVTDSRTRRFAPNSADATQKRIGTVQNRPHESNWRSTIARKSGVPNPGAAPSAGASSPRSKRSRATKTIPPQSPHEGFPIPMWRIPRFHWRAGPDAQKLENRRPWRDGRKPGTALVGMPSSGRTGEAAPPLLHGRLELEPPIPDSIERELQRAGQRGVLDDHDREVLGARHRVLHPEQDRGLIDDHELERHVVDESRLLAGIDEALDATRHRVVVENVELVDAPSHVRAGDLDALDVLLRRRGTGRLREDQDLLLHPALELDEALVDGATVPEDLDVLERIAVRAPGLELRPEAPDHVVGITLEGGHRHATAGDEALDGETWSERRVLHDGSRAGGREALLDQTGKDVVDALARQPGGPGDLGGGERIATDEGHVRPGLVGRESKPDKALDRRRVVHGG